MEEALYLCSEIIPDIKTVLSIITICRASGAVVERGFSLMNLIMNNMQSSMNVRILDDKCVFTIIVLIYLMKRLTKLLMYRREGEIEELSCEFI